MFMSVLITHRALTDSQTMQIQGPGGRAKRVKPSMPVFGRKKASKSQAATSTLISKWQAVQQVKLEAALRETDNQSHELFAAC